MCHDRLLLVCTMPTATPQTILPTTSSQQQLSHTFIILLGDCHSVGYDPTSPVLSVEDPRASMEMLGRTRRRIHSQRFLWLVCAVIVSLASARTTAMTRSNARGTKPAELGTPSRNTLSINSLDSVMDLKRYVVDWDLFSWTKTCHGCRA